ncbi:cytochrome P450 [Cadophora sp. DSE1049]|nr:cytochrome P450 [Cadophora sp. DSE1049]
MLTVVLVVEALIILSILYRIFRAASSPLRSIPGPFLARFTRLWYFGKLHAYNYQETNIALHRRYGRIVRIAPNEYSIDDLDAAKIIYGHGSQFTKSNWYMGFSPSAQGNESIFSERNNAVHAANRRKTAAAYSLSSLLAYEGFVDHCVSLLCQRFEEFAATSKDFQLAHWLQCYAFDVIGCITFEKRFGFLDTGDDIGSIMSSLETQMLWSSLVGVYNEFAFAFWTILEKVAGKGAGFPYVMAWTSAAIDERKALGDGCELQKSCPKSLPMLDKFLNSKCQDPEKFTDWDVIISCLNNTVAGSDTTGISLSAAMCYLMHNPPVLSKLREEVVQACGHDGDITFEKTRQMPYLNAVIKETLRVHPATGMTMPRVVPKGGKEIAGKFFPEGTIVGINSWVAHASESVFGPDAAVFRPERWIELSPEQLSLMERYYMPFGLGSRTCIGKNISLLEMTKLIPTLVRRYDFSIVPGTDWTIKGRWFVKQRDLRCVVVPREF